MTDLHKTLDEVLRESVISMTGHDYGPRPGQRDLAHDILTAMETRGRVSGVGPTGVGKTLAVLAPAMVMATMCDERTVVSTESLSLQHQYLDKDAPVIAEATEKVTGRLPIVAVHKGFSNHVCYLAAHSAAEQVTKAGLVAPAVNNMASLTFQREAAKSAIREAHEAVLSHKGGARRRMKVGDQTFEPKPYLELLRWATNLREDGDKARFEGDLPRGGWGTVSLTPQECPGAKGCPFASICLPRAARDRAAEADIVVTNHALLGIQAATAAPVVLGNRKLGNFQHIMVDEAHGLPGIVRNGGAIDIGPRRVGGVVAAVNGIFDTQRDKEARDLVDAGNDIADELEKTLNRVRGLTPESPVEFTEDMTGITDSLSEVLGWASAAKALIPDGDADLTAYLRLIRAKSRVTKLAEDIDTVMSEDPLVPMARWMEDGPYGRSFKASPVDVSPHIAANLFTAKLVPDEHNTDDDIRDEETGEARKVPISVTMVSATLPTSFRRDTGIGVETKDYPSPFDTAYGSSMAYCPKPETDDLPMMATQYNGRWKFDTNKHADWATERIIELVEANGGSALILSANKKNGEKYAAALRRRTSLAVHSQWDGRDPRLIIDEWRHDVGSVMVGTRSLMTGVDAKGETCTLVVIDRVPRAMGNVVDDARVKAIAEQLDLDKWSADKFVYVSDAALLLEQAFGRLIRTMDDSGLAVCLDPRIVPGSPLSYRRDVTDIYLKAMRRFSNRRSSLTSALDYIKDKQA